jgi:putative transposase
MDKSRENAAGMPEAAVAAAWQLVGASFERFCLAAGVRALSEMMEQDAIELCGPRYGHKDGKAAHRWGKTEGKIGFHGGKVSLTRRMTGAAAEYGARRAWSAGQ